MATFFSATSRGIHPGIDITAATAAAATKCIALGETGRSRRLVEIRIAPGVEIVVDELHRQLVEEGALVGGPAPRIEAGPAGSAVVVRARTDAAYTRGCPGSLDAGSWHVVAEGRTAWGAAGRVGQHPDALLVATDEAVATVKFSGGRRKGQGRRLLVAIRRDGALVPVLVDTVVDARPELRPENVLTLDELRRVAGMVPAAWLASWDLADRIADLEAPAPTY